MTAPGYRKPDGTEVRLGHVQRGRLLACLVEGPQRAGPRSPPFVRLVREGFVTIEQHFSARTGEPTGDRVYPITDEGRRYLAVGRVR